MSDSACHDCGHKFYLRGSDLNNIISGGGCPSCGSNQIYRDQPSPTKSDMTQRDMPEDGFGDDTGGNPMNTGILAKPDYKPVGIRDDGVMASVHTADGGPQHHGTAAVHPRLGLHNGPLYMLKFLDAHVNGKPARTHSDEIFAEHSPLNPNWDQSPVKVSTHHPEHLPAAVEEIARGGGPSDPGPEFRKMLDGIQGGTVPPPPGVGGEDISRASKVAGSMNLPPSPESPQHHAQAQPHPEIGLHNGTQGFLNFLDAHVNGKPVRSHQNEIFAEHTPMNPNWDRAPVTISVHHPEHLAAAVEEAERGGEMNSPGPEFNKLLDGVEAGTMPLPHGIPPDVDLGRRKSKVAGDFGGFIFGDGSKKETHKFIVGADGNVISLPSPTTHEEVARLHGRNLINDMGSSSLGVKFDDDSTDWYTHQSGHHPAALAGHLEGHFGHPVTIDPNLRPTTHEERFFGEEPPVEGDGRELSILDGSPRPRGVGTMRRRIPLDRSEGLVRGGGTRDMEPIIPWQYESSDEQHEASVEKDAFIPLAVGVGLAARAIAPRLLPAVGKYVMKAAVGQAAIGGVKKLLGVGGGQQQEPQQVVQGRPSQQLSRVADYETPSSVPSIGTHGGPEDVDPHEFNDGDHSPNGYDPTTNDMGGTDSPFHNPEISQQFNDLLPDLLDYAEKDKSGLEHPGIRALHDKIEAMHPGYHKSALPVMAPNAIQQQQQMVPQNNSTRVQPEVGPNTMTGKCPNCGSVLNGDGSCPQCPSQPAQQQQPMQQQFTGPSPGMAPQQVMGSTRLALVMNQQQMAAVADLLKSQGREDEIVDMLKNPERYADELAQIQNQPNQPPVVDPNAPPSPGPAGAGPPMDPSMMPPGAMPGMPPGGDPSMQMAAAVERFSADNVTPRCPKCHSATTGLVDGDSARCHRCGNIWAVKDLIKDEAGNKTKTSEEHHHVEPMTEIDAPAEEPAPAPEESTRTWEDDGGAPIQVGKEYEMHSSNYDIPDVVRVESVKPSAIEFTIQGEYGLNAKTEVTKHEADTMDYHFVPVDGTNEQPPTDPENRDGTPTTAPGEVSDLSGSPKMTATKPTVEQALATLREAGYEVAEPEHELTAEQPKPHLAWLKDDSSGAIDYLPSEGRTAGAKFTPMEQRDFIDEVGVARNSDKLELSGTHYKTRDSFDAKTDSSRVRDDDLFLGL